MQIKAIPSKWIENEGYRLDCGPYMSGAIEAREILKKLPTTPLQKLTAGHNGGIFNGPRFPRTYVTDPDHGVPFLGSVDILHADLSHLSLLSKKQVASNPDLLIDEGWTLITCSGTIGRMCYARADMAGMAGSQHFMRVVPNEGKVKSGYLYAFLSSRFGVPQVIAGTYGAIIQHIEPHHLANLPVPRLGEVEERAHELVQQAADLLVQYQAGILEATRLFFESVGLEDITPAEWHSWGSDVGFTITMNNAQSLRALNFNPRFQKLIERMKSVEWKPVGDLCMPDSLRRPNRFKRIEADEEFAYQLINQKQLFWLRPEGRLLSKNSIKDDVPVNEGTILVAARGTLGEHELYCRSEIVFGEAVQNVYSEDMLRIVPDERSICPGCLFAFTRSETAFRMLRSISIGSKLQDHHKTMLPSLPIPYPPSEIQRTIHALVVEAYESREKAIALEDEARELVEHAIEEGV